jgi:hypothetical protein
MRLRLRSMKRNTRQRELVDSAMAAYREWQRECGAVGSAYRRWMGASPLEKRWAFGAYNAALDREEQAAARYARMLSLAGHLPETGLARQLALNPAASRE